MREREGERVREGGGESLLARPVCVCVCVCEPENEREKVSE